MKTLSKHTGFAIAIAWPQTYCKQPGAWYDGFLYRLGINENNYYKVGHAALVLIDTENEKCHYFDFGRYHTPFQHGRVRSANTDDDLKMETTPKISEDGKKLENFREILLELQNNKACHGEGELYASYTPIDFNTAFDKANHMQSISPIPYGPFSYKGSNCSRFVNTAILAGKPDWKYRFKLKYFVPLSPTPINNVNALDNKLALPEMLKGELFCPIAKLDKALLKTTLKQPDRNPNIPKKAQWLSGEGAGSWFVFDIENTLLKVSRYSPEGVLECTGFYENQNGRQTIPEDALSITYPSNCKEVSFIYNDDEVRFLTLIQFRPHIQYLKYLNLMEEEVENYEFLQNPKK